MSRRTERDRKNGETGKEIPEGRRDGVLRVRRTIDWIKDNCSENGISYPVPVLLARIIEDSPALKGRVIYGMR